MNKTEITFCVGELINGEIFVWSNDENLEEFNTFCKVDRLFSSMGDITERVMEKYHVRPRFIYGE